jgi:hypothetical protein
MRWSVAVRHCVGFAARALSPEASRRTRVSDELSTEVVQVVSDPTPPGGGFFPRSEGCKATHIEEGRLHRPIDLQ